LVTLLFLIYSLSPLLRRELAQANAGFFVVTAMNIQGPSVNQLITL
jgi:hypothetical protein